MTDYCRVNYDTNCHYENIDRLTADFEDMLSDKRFKKAYNIYCKKIGGLSTITDYDIMKIEEIKEQL